MTSRTAKRLSAGLRRWLQPLLAAVLLVASAAGAQPALVLEERSAIEQVLRVADERLDLMPAVAAAKQQRRLPVADPAREQQVIDLAVTRASELGLDGPAVADVFAVQIRIARDAQTRLLQRWSGSGFDFPGPVPDLAADIRPRLDALTGRLLAALYLAVPGLVHAGAAGIEALPIDTLLPAPRWTPAERQALTQALVRVRFVRPSSLARAQAAGVLRVGMPSDYAPFGLVRDGRVDGADVDLTRSLAAALGLEPVYVATTWGRLLEDLAADRFDLAAGGVSLTPGRLAVAEGSLATSRSGKTALGRCADRGRYAALERINRPAVTVIENPGGTNEGFARRLAPRAHLVVHPDNLTVFDELEAGRADVMFTDDAEVRLVTRRHPALCRLLRESFDEVDKGLLLAPGGGWKPAVDAWLAGALREGVPERAIQSAIDRFAPGP